MSARIWFALLLPLLACDKLPQVECVDAGDCDGLAVCTEAGTCRTVDCLVSDDCALGSHCNVEANTCFSGCAENTDCTVGQVCDTATTQCVQGECEDAVVDCYPGQTCTEGTCDRGLLCEECTTATSDPCAQAGGTCRYVYSGSGYDYLCLTGCDPTATEGGPRDFVCEDIAYNPNNDPAIAVWRWWGDCGRALEAPESDSP